LTRRRQRQRSNYWILAPYVRQEWRTIAQAMVGTIIFVAYWPILAWLAGKIMAALSNGDVGTVSRLMVITLFGVPHSENWSVYPGCPDVEGRIAGGL
jgi:ATP-binding cassette subfamily B protein